MFRMTLCVAAALLTLGVATRPATTDDLETCRNVRLPEAPGEETMAACSRLIEQNTRDFVPMLSVPGPLWAQSRLRAPTPR
jgi:hypothetical protein